MFKVLKIVICKNFGEVYIFFNSHTLAPIVRFDLKKKLPEPPRLPSYDLTALGTRFCSTVQCVIVCACLSNQHLTDRCTYVSVSKQIVVLMYLYLQYRSHDIIFLELQGKIFITQKKTTDRVKNYDSIRIDSQRRMPVESS